MQHSDLDQVYELERELFPNPWPRSFFESDLQLDHNLAFIVEFNKSIIGYAMAVFDHNKLHITNIAVDARFQRKGIGLKMMHMLEDIALRKGYTSAYLEVRVNNKSAINFYINLGYKIADKRDNYYIDGDDAYVMEKELK